MILHDKCCKFIFNWLDNIIISCLFSVSNYEKLSYLSLKSWEGRSVLDDWLCCAKGFKNHYLGVKGRFLIGMCLNSTHDFEKPPINWFSSISEIRRIQTVAHPRGTEVLPKEYFSHEFLNYYSESARKYSFKMTDDDVFFFQIVLLR